MVASALAVAKADSPRWQASLSLDLARRQGRTRLTGCRHRGPLYVQKPFYPEGGDWPHIYLLHPPGGIVSGDRLDIDVSVGQDAAALLTTPGAARVYRARKHLPRQEQNTRLCLEPGAALEWFPLETIVYDGADLVVNTTIELATGARCAAWEITCFGRPAGGELFERGSFRQLYRIDYEGRPLVVDRVDITGSNRNVMSARAGLQGYPVSGLFLMGPFDCESAGVLAALQSVTDAPGSIRCGGISRVGAFYVGRYLGSSAEQARALFAAWWALLRPRLVAREANAPRIWLT